MRTSRAAFATAFLIAAVSPARAQELPPGPGRDVVAANCGNCHPLFRLRAGYTADGWRTVLRMMRNSGVALTPAEHDAALAYLAKNFPERPRPPAVIVPGPVRVTIREWDLPTPGSRPHDPRVARDGSIWYTGQLANLLGRVDPATGRIVEFPLKTPHTGPHGLAEDAGGNIWFTGNGSGLIGRLDPRTGAVTEYRMPDPSVRDPHTLNFDRRGILWFTAQGANRIGRLDPETGEIRLVAPPTPRARPYGLMIDTKGVPVFVEFGTNKIATVDPATMAIREFVLPDPAARPRRLAITDDDIVWYTDFARGFLGRLDRATGAVREFPSPSGRRSQPYGIVAVNGVLWYSESFAKPNTIVRFDPKTEKFQSWAIPGGGDIVRNMDATPDGNPVMANSLVNRVGMVTVAK